MAKPAAKTAKKVKKNITTADVHVNASFNNTHGSRKSTPYAAQMAAEDAGRKAQEHGVKDVYVVVKGPGSGRESALRALGIIGLNVRSIKDITPVPHNGTRPRKRRRV